MADMLKFRKGTLAQINSADKKAGTIYIARDEKAMYVDVDDSTRIRIGDFVRVATVNDIPFPASTSALYYVEADNALLGYDGENWKQINGTKDLADRLTTAENAIDTVEGLVGTKTDAATVDTTFGRIAKNKADISTLNTYVGTIPANAEATNIVAYIEEKTSGIATDTALENLTNRVTQAEKDIDAVESTVSGHTNSISTINTTLGNKADTSYVDDTFVTKTEANPILAKVDTTKKVSEAIADAVAAEAAIARAAEEANASGVSEAKAAAAEAKTLAGSKATLDEVKALNYATKTEVESAVDTAIGNEVTRADGKYATKTALEATDGIVSGHTQAISNINTTLESVVTKTELEGKNYATTGQVATAKQEAIDAAATAAAGLYATIEALNTTNDNVSAAQGRADAAYELAESKTTETEVKTQIEAYGYATTGQVATAKQEAIDAAKTAGDKAYAAKDIESTVAGHTNDLTTLKGAATVEGSVANAKKAGTDALALIGDANSGLTQIVNAHTTSLTTLTGADNVNGSVANAKKAGTDAQATANANASAISKLQADLKAVTDDYVTESELATVKSDLQAEIDADIRAANAMEYAGTIESASELPATAKNGATYVVGAAFGDYAAGDMLIAQGTENPDTGLITNPTWAHVKSGYDASLDQKLTGADNKIKLSNGVGKAGTEVAFAGSGSIEISTVAATGNKPDTITIGMVWEDFDE